MKKIDEVVNAYVACGKAIGYFYAEMILMKYLPENKPDGKCFRRVSLNVTGWGKIGVWEPPIWQKKFAGVFGYFSGSGIFGGFNCLYIFYLLLGMNTQRASSLNLAINMEGR